MAGAANSPSAFHENATTTDGADTDAEDILRIAGEFRHRLTTGNDKRFPEIVVGMFGDPRFGKIHRLQFLPPLANDIAFEIEYDDF